MICRLILVLPLLIAQGHASEKLIDDDRGSIHLKTDLEQDQRDAVHLLAHETRQRVEGLLTNLGLSHKSNGLTRMRVYATGAGFEERKKRTTSVHRQWAGAYFSPGDNEIVLCWSGGSSGGRSALRHELTHLVLDEFCKNPPTWFSEGFACYVGACEFDPHGDPLRTQDSGRLRTIRRALESDTFCPLYRFMDLKGLEFYGLEGTKKLPWDRDIMYAQAWSLVYFLLNVAEGEDRELADLVATRLDTGRWKQSTFRKQLPELETRWRRFIARDDLVELDQLTSAARRDFELKKFEKGFEKARGALKIDPQRRAAQRVMAESAVALGRYPEALQACAMLLESRDDDSPAHLCRAKALLGQAIDQQQPETAALARDAARRASELAPVREKYVALLTAIKAEEYRGDVKGMLALVRETLRLKSVPREVASNLRDQEQALVKRAIGR